MHSKAAARNRWFTGWRFGDRAPRNDPADQGTAFGLDMSLADCAAAEAALAARAPGWVQRLTARLRPAA